MHVFRTGLRLVFIVFCLALAACGKSGQLSGTYASAVQSVTFDGDKATVSLMGKEIGKGWPYTVDGNKVTVKGPGGDLVLTRNDDGSLSDPSSDKLVKK